MYSFSPATVTLRGSTQLSLACYRLHCILRDGRDNERQLHCFRFLRSNQQVDSARKNRQLSDFYVHLWLYCVSPDERYHDPYPWLTKLSQCRKLNVSLSGLTILDYRDELIRSRRMNVNHNLFSSVLLIFHIGYVIALKTVIQVSFSRPCSKEPRFILEPRHIEHIFGVCGPHDLIHAL